MYAGHWLGLAERVWGQNSAYAESSCAVRQWDVKKEAALSRITEQRMNKEAVEAENAANNAKLAEHLVHVSTHRLFNDNVADL